MTALVAPVAGRLRFDPRFERFLGGDDRDPTMTILLAEDRWSLRAYQTRHGSRGMTVSFERLPVLAPYAKWYVLDRILTAGRAPSTAPSFMGALARAEREMAALGVTALEDLASADLFESVWSAIADPWLGPAGERPRSTVWRQQLTLPFWPALRRLVGVPISVPDVFPFARPSIAEVARRTEHVIPDPVIRQLGNRLGLHRDGSSPLAPRDHLRLCVLMLHIALGRRISELLLAPRGSGPRGPLVDYESVSGAAALGFRFEPNKDGRDDVVYVSPEWRDLVEYCVEALIAYGDEVRPFANAGEADRLVLVSGHYATRPRGMQVHGLRSRKQGLLPASVLPYAAFVVWLNGGHQKVPVEHGAMARLGITENGTPGGAVYWFRTHSARHTRQSVLRSDPTVSRLAVQRDLNVASVEAQSIYQHGLREQNDALRRRASAGELVGRGATWISAIEEGGRKPGHPTLLADHPRVLTILAANPDLLEFNRVPCGYCVRPQGPSACPEFLQCLEAADEGCAWFATDPTDERCLVESNERADAREKDEVEAGDRGALVLASKLGVEARRARSMADAITAAAPADALDRLRARLAAEERQ